MGVVVTQAQLLEAVRLLERRVTVTEDYVSPAIARIESKVDLVLKQLTMLRSENDPRRVPGSN